MKFETSARLTGELNFRHRKNDLLYIIQCFQRTLRCSIVYIDENCQATIILNNLGI